MAGYEPRYEKGKLKFQLVNDQVDIKCDGILGRDFLRQAQARICYRTRNLTFRYKGREVRKKLISSREESSELEGKNSTVGMITLPKRSEVIVKLPVTAGSTVREGLVEKREIQEGVYMAGCLARVADGHVVISILNTRDEEMKIVAPVVSVEEYMDEKTVEASESTQKRNSKCRDERVWEQLRTEHLNPEEQESLRKVCADYPDVFYIIKAAPMP